MTEKEGITSKDEINIMKNDEGFCSKCNKELWASKNELVCPDCNYWKDISNEKIKQCQNSIDKTIQEMNKLYNEIHYNVLLKKSLDKLEYTAKRLMLSKNNLEDSLYLIDEWIKFSLNLSLIINFPNSTNYSLPDTDINLLFYFGELDKFAKEFITLGKLHKRNLQIFKDGNKEIILVPPSKSIFTTPLSVLRIQNYNANLDVDIQNVKSVIDYYSLIDVNYFPTQFFRLIGTYLSDGIGLSKYLISNNKSEALRLLDLYSILHKELVKFPILNTHVFPEENFLKVFGKKTLEELLFFSKKAKFSYKNNINFIPSIFLKISKNHEKSILPLYFSNRFFEEILQVKTNNKLIGEIATLKGTSFEDELFGFCETLNVEGELDGQKLLRIPYPIKSSKMKELADMLFIGNRTGSIYIISAKSHTVLTLKSLHKELLRYHQEQEQIKDGMKHLGIYNDKMHWLFITPLTWIPSFRNIKIFNIIQMLGFIVNKEGLKQITLQSEDESLKLKNFDRYDHFNIENRRFCIEICKVIEIEKSELKLWIHKPQIYFAKIRVDIPDFVDADHLRVGQWIKILLEFRTKYSTQIVSYHDAEILSETKAHSILMKRKILPPYP